MTFDVGLFNSYWHLISHRNELPRSGDYVRFDTPISEVVIYNDEGNLIAFDNKCPHRGTRIFIENQSSQPLHCRYHGWSYRAGKVIIPDPQNFQPCALDSAKLNTYQLEWCGDFIFVGIQPLTSLQEQLGAFTETLENISFNINAQIDLNRFEFQSYWPIAVENALEPYHIPLIHKDTLATLELEPGINEFNGCNSIWHAPIGNARTHKQLRSLKRLFNIDYQQEEYMSIFLFPFSMISSTFGYSYSIQNFFPSKHTDTTHFTSRLYSVHAASENATKIIHPFLESTKNINRKVFDEDHDICKLVSPESWTSAPLPFASIQESKLVHFREQCSNFLATEVSVDKAVKVPNALS